MSLEGSGNANFHVDAKDLMEAGCSQNVKSEFKVVQIEDITSDQDVDQM